MISVLPWASAVIVPSALTLAAFGSERVYLSCLFVAFVGATVVSSFCFAPIFKVSSDCFAVILVTFTCGAAGAFTVTCTVTFFLLPAVR